MPLVPWLWGREGVSVFMQPPISTRSPATSIMRYSELDSKDLTVPRATIGETSAAQMTAPRSLHTLTRSRCGCRVPRASRRSSAPTQ